MSLIIKDLYVEVDNKEILKGINLEIKENETTALMGPNGSGKSTLSLVLMGHPNYKITKGQILIDNEDITSLEPDERAKKGLFLSFQYPQEIQGVNIVNFLKTAYNSIYPNNKLSVMDFMKHIKEKMSILNMNEDFLKRDLNLGFSGGEKKRSEILQMLILEPKYAILDETDSGLDVDALKDVSKGINELKKNKSGILLITHYQRILHYVIPDKVYVLMNGKIIASGSKELAEEIEKKGYKLFSNTFSST
ncbi:MAG: Fe-S cluster assembly ATPase SufC [Candidatus Woesearchaeota archaeon]